MAGESPFQDFRRYLLKFDIMVSGAEDEDTGNFDTSEVNIGGTELDCTLKASSDPRIVALAGADTTVVALSGRCVEPMTIPPGVKPGSKTKLEINGVSGVFTLGPTFPTLIPEVEEALGQKIVGTWQVG